MTRVVVSKWDDNGCGLQVGWQWLWSPSGMTMVVVSKWDDNGCGLQVGWQWLWSPSGMAMVVVSSVLCISPLMCCVPYREST